MDLNVDSDKFIRRIGERLVEEIKDAKVGSRPGS